MRRSQRVPDGGRPLHKILTIFIHNLGAFNKWKAGNVSLDIEHHTLGFSSNTKLELNLEKVEEKNLVQDEVETLINENELHNDELNEISKLLSNISEYKMEVFIYTRQNFILNFLTIF